jgi:hypothetical protein
MTTVTSIVLLVDIILVLGMALMVIEEGMTTDFCYLWG